MASTIGTRVPFHSSAVGKAYLAAMQKSEADLLIDQLEMPEITERSLTNKEQFKCYIEQVRTQGYSFESEENERGIACFGAAIRNAKGVPIASVSVSVPMFRLAPEHSHYYLAVQQACANISRKMGFI